MLPQLVHEHQVGFVNRVVEAGYRARTDLFADHGALTTAHAAELDEQARLLVRYVLFADEVPLPPGAVKGDAAFETDFAREGRVPRMARRSRISICGTRLFKNRCSYLIYTATFQGLPAEMKQRVFRSASAKRSMGKNRTGSLRICPQWRSRRFGRSSRPRYPISPAAW